VTLPVARYESDAEVLTTLGKIEDQMRTLPGVRFVGGTSHLPLSGRDGRRGIGIEGRQPTPDVPTRAHPRSVTPDYFRAMGITVLSGRPFTSADGVDAPKVAIVNDTMARRYWPNRSPLGARVMIGGAPGWIEIVGITADVKHWGLDQKVNPEIYVPLPQALSRTVTFVIAAAGDPASLAPALRGRVRTIDPNLPLNGVRTMEEVASVSVASRRAGMLLLAVFGVLALVLAAAGIHGVMSHLVALRTAEIGVRMTLGATPGDVMALVLREGTIQAIIGLAIGLSGGVLLMRAFQTMLFGVAPADPITLSAVAGVLLTTALAACIVPARKAMHVDPVNAVRTS
jgi:putative ABC transport system permease protein